MSLPTSTRLGPFLMLLAAACSTTTSTQPITTEPSEPIGAASYTGDLSFEVVATYPHDPLAFTQGLEFYQGKLIESTGRYGESDRRVVDLESGEVTSIETLPDDRFAEGLTLVGDRLIQLTWKSGEAIVADAGTLQEIERFSYEGEGWGICESDSGLIMSDGSASLTFRSAKNFVVTGMVEVTRDGAPVERLNELECVAGLVFANVWLTTEIVVIDPSSGAALAKLDLTALVPEGLADPGGQVLNGIAYRADTDTFLVTGKNWPVLYELRLTGS